MPGYRSLSTHLSGTAADHAREAEAHQRGGDAAMAAQLLEEALEASVRTRPEMPGWICGRLASIYRSLKRYDDEVMLLERYRETQTTEEARTRFDARLSKARAIAERQRRPVTGALETVRQVRRRSKERRRGPPRAAARVPRPALRRRPRARPADGGSRRDAEGGVGGGARAPRSVAGGLEPTAIECPRGAARALLRGSSLTAVSW